MARLAALLAAVLLLASCAPAASWVRDQLDSGEGATLLLVAGGGVFNPGGREAFDVRVTFRSAESDMALAAGQDHCEVSGDGRYVDCEFASVAEPIEMSFSGSRVIGSAVYVRSPGSIDWLWAYTPVE